MILRWVWENMSSRYMPIEPVEFGFSIQGMQALKDENDAGLSNATNEYQRGIARLAQAQHVMVRAAHAKWKAGGH